MASTRMHFRLSLTLAVAMYSLTDSGLSRIVFLAIDLMQDSVLLIVASLYGFFRIQRPNVTRIEDNAGLGKFDGSSIGGPGGIRTLDQQVSSCWLMSFDIGFLSL